MPLPSSAVDSPESYVVVGLIGALVGLVELITRYRDRPSALIRVASFWVYLAVNAAASVAALYILSVLDLQFGTQTPAQHFLTVVLLAGFGAMALFRTKLFTIRVGDQDVGIGPSAVLDGILIAADRAVDRARARTRSHEVTKIMAKVDFVKARASLPAYCLQLMQNLPVEEGVKISEAVERLANADTPDTTKSVNLGLLLMNVVGPVVLEAAVRDLGAAIQA